ncbi:MAG: hypothetical protein RLO12_15265, partial [Fulvivirga sp.]
MNFKILLNLLSCLLLLLSSCTNKSEVKKFNSIELIEQVKSQVNSFQAADTTLNSKGVLDLLWPEFTMLSDGNYITYDDVSKGSKAFMSSLESFNTKWDSLRIIPLGNDHAISSFIFTDSIVSKDGTITQSRGPNTFVWEKRNEE